MRVLNNLFVQNKKWAERVKESNPDFFSNLSKQQKPEYLWIGCSDSRVPASQIVDLLPGQLFVHRNIANIVAHTDLNCIAVIQYAVKILKVKHIIVCGHYDCGGVQAVWKNKEYGLIDYWLRKVKDVLRFHQTKIDMLSSDKEKVDLLCELNVIEQVKNVCGMPVVRSAWKKNQDLAVHGWIYSVEDGILKDLNMCITNISEIPNA